MEFSLLDVLDAPERVALESRLRVARFRRGQAVFNDGGTLKEVVERLEMRLVSQALQRLKWNYTKAARELGLSRVGLANKIKRYNLDKQVH